MRFLNGNSATSKGAGQRRTYPGFHHALIFAIGAALGSILATLIGLEYTSWVIIALCWPMALIFGMFERPRENRLQIPGTKRPWHSKAGKRSTAPPSPGRPPQRPTGRGLHRVK
jgi:hypothetical protein